MSAFLDVIDKIIQLTKTREERQIRLFSEIIEPLFHELHPIVNNQLAVFTHSLHLLDTVRDTPGAADLVWKQRTEHLLSRIYAREMARFLKEEYSESAIQEFGDRILKLFQSGVRVGIIPGPTEESSSLVVLYDLFDFLERGRLVPHFEFEGPIRQCPRYQTVSDRELREFIVSTIRSIEVRWADVCFQYAIVQNKLLSSQSAWERHIDRKALSK